MMLATLGLMIGVLCVCVGVGTITYRRRTGRRPGAIFRATVVVLAPIAHVASFVIMLILDSKGVIPDRANEILQIFYAPIAWIIHWTLWKLGVELD